jgi:hypothetical protein
MAFATVLSRVTEPGRVLVFQARIVRSWISAPRTRAVHRAATKRRLDRHRPNAVANIIVGATFDGIIRVIAEHPIQQPATAITGFRFLAHLWPLPPARRRRDRLRRGALAGP